MINFHNKKNKRIISTIVIILLVLAMIIPAFAGLL